METETERQFFKCVYFWNRLKESFGKEGVSSARLNNPLTLRNIFVPQAFVFLSFNKLIGQI